jgi:hypothetical protein
MNSKFNKGDLVVRYLDELKDNPDIFLIMDIERIAGYEFIYLMDFVNGKMIKKIKSDYITFNAWLDRRAKIEIAKKYYNSAG